MKHLQIELKVCESCGALWLRPLSVDGPYCAGCSRKLANFPASKGRHPGGRPSRSGRVSKRCSNGRFAGETR
ncbi:MAG: hypothetical protein M3O31_05460 [Acidobacteriota bacterium]|nr:hypothetical protein [Acidobacteriota bacterium]